MKELTRTRKTSETVTRRGVHRVELHCKDGVIQSALVYPELQTTADGKITGSVTGGSVVLTGEEFAGVNDQIQNLVDDLLDAHYAGQLASYLTQINGYQEQVETTKDQSVVGLYKERAETLHAMATTAFSFVETNASVADFAEIEAKRKEIADFEMKAIAQEAAIQ